ncbi:unnamed protein product [Polarella glacialis]|uniref:Uncharacterized protein n=1 Tax=Polarella glacialis TaxID=89957 RepID=A0A813M162_POLGL|nr:unnamed protein product [Polarella glacialis]
MIGGYYDYSPCKGCARNGTAAAEREFRFAAGIEGIEGFSYTTWGSNNALRSKFSSSFALPCHQLASRTTSSKKLLQASGFCTAVLSIGASERWYCAPAFLPAGAFAPPCGHELTNKPPTASHKLQKLQIACKHPRCSKLGDWPGVRVSIGSGGKNSSGQNRLREELAGLAGAALISGTSLASHVGELDVGRADQVVQVPEPAQTPVGRSSDPATTTTSDPVVVLLFLLLLLLLFGVVVGAGLAAAPRKMRARSLSTNTNTNTNSNNHSNNNNNDIRLTSL